MSRGVYAASYFSLIRTASSPGSALFFFNDTATTEIYTLSLHDALPISYPLQFAPGALINTAGSGNDFVGGTNGDGNVQFNGLPALSHGYIVDGLETNDPLTNLNNGLSTNLVLGVNSISEVTVNTLFYSVRSE